jgi:hypothetical protein
MLMRLLVLLFLAACSPVYAQQSCGSRTDIVASLQTKYGEVQIGAGGGQGGHYIIEIWANDTTWTALVSYPDGTSCIAAAGQNWQIVAAPVAGKPASYSTDSFTVSK